MRFYGREEQIEELRAGRSRAFEDHSRFTVVTGRRRIGKTTLVMKALGEQNTLYLFVARKNEALLCADFSEQINATLDTFVPPETNTFKSLFTFLFKLAEVQEYSLVIDEFQEFFNINSSFYSDLQNLWDRHRNKTKVNLVVCGSVYSLIHKIFRDKKEPLFGRADAYIQLTPFNIATLKAILCDMNPRYVPDDLLALYTITGAVPKYVELFFDSGSSNLKQMVNFMVREGSPFIDEGKNLLIEEFGKNYATYFSILSTLSSGVNTQSRIEDVLGGISIGGHLKRLVDDYGILERKIPLLAKKGTQAVRYQIRDNFIQFWFKYFDGNQSLVEIKNYPALRSLMISDFPSYSGRLLERYFVQKFAESYEFSNIGSWWETGKEHHDIDIVALYLESKSALAVEVKRQARKFQPETLHSRVQHLQEKVLQGYAVKEQCLSLEDM
ncbi:MAG: ATP-binding protein [Coriobacteriales bacterium]|jgi:AAA+ ATPase superfamily predicted ATPase|nr:ATP-binding protein [Coriobacteriales bacterium]